MGGQEEPSVLRESGEHEGEINDVEPILGELME
jgi:hypothetical protein